MFQISPNKAEIYTIFLEHFHVQLWPYNDQNKVEFLRRSKQIRIVFATYCWLTVYDFICVDGEYICITQTLVGGIVHVSHCAQHSSFVHRQDLLFDLFIATQLHSSILIDEISTIFFTI